MPKLLELELSTLANKISIYWEKKMQWTKLSDKLPEVGKKYLLTRGRFYVSSDKKELFLLELFEVCEFYRPFDYDKKYNENYYLWLPVNHHLIHDGKKDDLSVQDNDYYCEIKLIEYEKS